VLILRVERPAKSVLKKIVVQNDVAGIRLHSIEAAEDGRVERIQQAAQSDGGKEQETEFGHGRGLVILSEQA